MSCFAEYEAKKISCRTKVGLGRTGEKRKQIGRPSKFDRYENDLWEMMEEDLSKAQMKRRAFIGIGSPQATREARHEGSASDFRDTIAKTGG